MQATTTRSAGGDEVQHAHRLEFAGVLARPEAGGVGGERFAHAGADGDDAHGTVQGGQSEPAADSCAVPSAGGGARERRFRQAQGYFSPMAAQSAA